MRLFIDACVREESRTRRLANRLLAHLGTPDRTLKLDRARFPVADESFLKRRDGLLARGWTDAPIFDFARQFAEADEIVIAAPCWDLSFPAVLKQYLEQVNVVGITFRYGEDGIPVGLCRAKRLFYLTTSGGCHLPDAFGYGYVEALSRGFYGIEEVLQIKAEGLDLDGADVEAILREAEQRIDRLFG